MLRAGADKVSVNTAAVQRPELIREIAAEFGSQCVVCAIDAKRDLEGGSWRVYLHGGRTPTGIDAIEWAARATSLGAGEILLTSMDRDGTREGFDLELTAAVGDAVTVPVIASGGVGTLEHLVEALGRALCLDLADGILERHALAGDVLLRKGGIHIPQLGEKSSPRAVIHRAARLAGVVRQCPNGTGDQGRVVGHRNSLLAPQLLLEGIAHQNRVIALRAG